MKGSRIGFAVFASAFYTVWDSFNCIIASSMKGCQANLERESLGRRIYQHVEKLEIVVKRRRHSLQAFQQSGSL
jgi:hypothetical protein